MDLPTNDSSAVPDEPSCERAEWFGDCLVSDLHREGGWLGVGAEDVTIEKERRPTSCASRHPCADPVAMHLVDDAESLSDQPGIDDGYISPECGTAVAEAL
ncbi:hypothetical protein [Friedmanniella luteola]|uniref:hypothetical protein n=1 Tax=Friedmanniella luteola TaxID=546871 RepID=UPI0012FE517C|nr:hypothetical protein [Friedmanniella luteola]